VLYTHFRPVSSPQITCLLEISPQIRSAAWLTLLLGSRISRMFCADLARIALVPGWLRASMVTRLHCTCSALTLLTPAAFPLVPRFLGMSRPVWFTFLTVNSSVPNFVTEPTSIWRAVCRSSFPTRVRSRIFVNYPYSERVFVSQIFCQAWLGWAYARKLTVPTRQIHLTVFIHISHLSQFFRIITICS